MAIIRTLGVQFKAETKKFDSNVKQSQKNVAGFSDSFKLAAAAAAAFASALVAVRAGMRLSAEIDAPTIAPVA